MKIEERDGCGGGVTTREENGIQINNDPGQHRQEEQRV